MIGWLFQSEARLKIVAVGAGTFIVILFVLMIMGGGEAAHRNSPAINTEGTSISLQPPSPQPMATDPVRTYGRSDPIALEAVHAWLLGDMRTFAGLATPEVMEEASAAPRPAGGQRITGDVKVLLSGPTRQKVQVPITDGPINLDMVIIDGAWMVRDMRYHR